MASTVVLLAVVVYCLSICFNGVGGTRFSGEEFDLEKQLELLKQRLSREEDLELEKQLKLLNKPAVEIIRTKYGESYACVDFYKQPAFDHPSLKNHTFRFPMKPTSNPKGKTNQESSTVKNSYTDIWLNGKGCPFGTVPIKRVTKDDLIRAKLATEIYGSKMNPLTPDQPGTYYAVTHTNSTDPIKKYNGGGMYISVYNPPVQGIQYSSGRMKIQNGYDFIEVGWIVNPTLYKDNRTHLFIYTSAGDSHCFDTLCPGIIVVNTQIPLGSVIDPISKRGGQIYDVKFFIYKDAANGGWYLNIGSDDIQLGYWPKNIFTGLADMASFVEWGGEAYSPPGVPSPPMGSGQYPVLNTKYDGFCAQVTTVNENHEIWVADYTQVFMNGKYVVYDEGIQSGNIGHLVLFGGPGGGSIGD